MKITVEFNMPDDEYKYKMFNNGHKYFRILIDHYEYLKSIIKYNNNNISEEELEKYQTIFTHLCNEIQDNSIDLYEE